MKNASIPASWRTVRLGEILKKIGSGVTPKGGKENYVSDGVPLIRSQNVLWGKLSLRDVAFIPHGQHNRMLGSTVQPMDVLLNITGASIGRACVVPPETPEANVNQHVCILRPREELSPQFLLAQLLSTDGQRQIDLFQAGGNREGLNYDQIRSIKFSLPPLPEQRKIADILSTWDESLETLDALIAAKARQKQALMQQLLTGKTRVKGAKGKRVTAKIGELFEERVERDRIDLPLLSITADRGVIPRDELSKKDTSSEDKSKYLRIAPGDIGYNTMRMWQGVSALSAFEGIVSPAYTICRPTDRIDGNFAAHFFKFTHTVHLFHRYSQGLVDDTLNLKFPHFSVIEVEIPESVAEQQQIATILDTADQELTLLRTQRQTLDQQKRGLMQRLLTGKIRVITNSQ